MACTVRTLRSKHAYMHAACRRTINLSIPACYICRSHDGLVSLQSGGGAEGHKRQGHKDNGRSAPRSQLDDMMGGIYRVVWAASCVVVRPCPRSVLPEQGLQQAHRF